MSTRAVYSVKEHNFCHITFNFFRNYFLWIIFRIVCWRTTLVFGSRQHRYLSDVKKRLLRTLILASIYCITYLFVAAVNDVEIADLHPCWCWYTCSTFSVYFFLITLVLLSQIMGVEFLFFVQTNTLHHRDRVLEIEAYNESFSSRVFINETCKYSVCSLCLSVQLFLPYLLPLSK